MESSSDKVKLVFILNGEKEAVLGFLKQYSVKKNEEKLDFCESTKEDCSIDFSGVASYKYCHFHKNYPYLYLDDFAFKECADKLSGKKLIEKISEAIKDSCINRSSKVEMAFIRIQE